MKQVTDVATYRALTKEVEINFDLKKDLPNQIFKNYAHFIFLEFEAFMLDVFFHSITNISSKLFFYTLDPHPKEYYYHHFNKFNVFEFTDCDTHLGYLDLLHQQPDPSSADAIVDTVNSMVVCSYKRELAIYGDRTLECLIVGFKASLFKKKFIEDYGKKGIYTFEDAVEELIPSSYRNNEVLEANYNK